MNAPKDLKYTKTDEWIKVDGTTASVGITDYAQDSLSDVVFVEILSSVGDDIGEGENCAIIESVKAAADVHSPVSGKVTEINEDLADAPEKVNSSPYDEAWMIKLELSDPDELKSLMSADEYEKFCEERSH